MKKLIKQVLESIETESGEWEPVCKYHDWDGIEKEGISLTFMGNTKILSILFFTVNGKNVQITWWEKYCLEGACLKWYKECDITKLTNAKQKKR